jgi:hypothetical protein
VPPLDHSCSFYLVWCGLVHALILLHTPLASFGSICISKRCGMGVGGSGCDTRSNSVLLVLPSICILSTFIGHNHWQGVYGIAWHGAHGRFRFGMKSDLYITAMFCFGWSTVENSFLYQMPSFIRFHDFRVVATCLRCQAVRRVEGWR